MKTESSNLEIVQDLIRITLKINNTAAELIETTKSNEILKQWYIRINAVFTTYWASLTGLEKSLEEITRIVPEGNFNYILTSTVFKIIFDTVNIFDYFTELIKLNSATYKNKLGEMKGSVISSLETDWRPSTNRLQERKKSLIKSLKQFDNQEDKRNALKKINALSSMDSDFLEFVWSIRNTMHYHYKLNKDINYSILSIDGKEIYKVNLKRGEYLRIAGSVAIIPFVASKMLDIMSKIITDIPDLKINKYQDM
jgi:hypothetical protein